MIEKIVDAQQQLTTFKCTGEITAQEILNVLVPFYKESPTLYALWDLTNARLINYSTEQSKQISVTAHALGSSRVGGKTAVVVASDHDYGMGRAAQIMYEIKNIPIEVNVFRSIEEAKHWLFLK